MAENPNDFQNRIAGIAIAVLLFVALSLLIGFISLVVKASDSGPMFSP